MTMERKVGILNRLLEVASVIVGIIPMVTTFVILINGFTTENIAAAILFSVGATILGIAATVIIFVITLFRITADMADYNTTLSHFVEEAKKGE